MSDTPLPHTTAQWDISLHADCPRCATYLDLLEEIPDFWDGRKLEVAEHGTERSRAVEVHCVKCGCEFTVECIY